MTDTLPRGAANQAGAIINPNAAAEAQDFLPLKGIDHVEFWVGNAKQAAHYYRTLWGFTPVAYAGLETGVRDRSSFVLVQNDIRFVFTAPISPDGEIAEHVREARRRRAGHRVRGRRRRVGLARRRRSAAQSQRWSRRRSRARRASSAGARSTPTAR